MNGKNKIWLILRGWRVGQGSQIAKVGLYFQFWERPQRQDPWGIQQILIKIKTLYLRV